jgi:hypothetical protein
VIQRCLDRLSAAVAKLRDKHDKAEAAAIRDELRPPAVSNLQSRLDLN